MSKEAAGRNGLKKAVTLRDVAREVGVTPAAASYALNGKSRIAPETRRQVIEAAQRLGYEADFFAQGLRRRSNDEIALFSLDVDMGIGTRKLQLIQHHLHHAGYRVPLYGFGYSDAKESESQIALLNTVLRQNPRALICNTAGLQESALREVRRYHEEGGTAVCYDHEVDITCDQVVFDRAAHMCMSVRHLLELGHRDIGLFIVGSRKPTGAKFEGFRQALDEFGAPLRAEWMLSSACEVEFEEDGILAAHQFLALKPDERPSAICIVNDHVALTFVAEVMRAGVRVPHDLSVIGHDDRAIAPYCAVPLSSVSHPAADIAAHVVSLLQSRLEEPAEKAHEPRRIEVRGHLVARQSTAPPSRTGTPSHSNISDGTSSSASSPVSRSVSHAAS